MGRFIESGSQSLPWCYPGANRPESAGQRPESARLVPSGFQNGRNRAARGQIAVDSHRCGTKATSGRDSAAIRP